MRGVRARIRPARNPLSSAVPATMVVYGPGANPANRPRMMAVKNVVLT
jgi:hypothetical protein